MKDPYDGYVFWPFVARRSACLRHMKTISKVVESGIGGKGWEYNSEKNHFAEWYIDSSYCLDRAMTSWPDFSGVDFGWILQ